MWVGLACYFSLKPLLQRGSEKLQLTVPSWNLIGFWSACGAAVLSKGPLGVVLPLAISFFAYGIICGWSTALKAMLRPSLGWIAFLALALPWYVLAALRGGDEFVGRQLIFENLQRFVGGEFVNQQPWYFYAPEFLFGTMPWSLIFLALISYWALRAHGVCRIYALHGRAALSGEMALVIWVLVGLLIFSIASGKRASYLLPLMPALAAWCAGGMSRCWSECSITRRLVWLKVSGYFAIAIIFVQIALLLGLSMALDAQIWSMIELSNYYQQLQPLILKSVKIGLLVTAATILLFKLKLLPLFSAVPIFLSFVVWFGFAVKGEFKGFRGMTQQVLDIVGNHKLAVVRSRADEYFDPILFLIDRPVQLISPDDTLTPESCTGYFLHHASFAVWKQCQCQEMLRLREWYLKQREAAGTVKSKKELVLTRCQ
jgi:4-amino-4-deoxy-L-arabinose transferase-like glycosyltransferase